MGKGRIWAWSILLVSGAAHADKPEPPVHFEVGFNTRHFVAVDGDDNTALRGEVSDPSREANTALTLDLRFTRWLPRNLYFGVEGEIGKLDAFDHSNLAGAYGLFGARGDIGFAQLFVEMAAGQRKVRYSDGMEDAARLIAEPRARMEVWLGPRVTLGGALGTTLGGRDVWMAGIYIGVHSLEYGHKQPF